MPERSNHLRLAIFKYGESVLVQISDHVLLVIDDGSVQHNFLHFSVENEAARLGTWLLPLGWGRLLWSRLALRRWLAGGGRLSLPASGIGLRWLRAARRRLGRGVLGPDSYIQQK